MSVLCVRFARSERASAAYIRDPVPVGRPPRRVLAAGGHRDRANAPVAHVDGEDVRNCARPDPDRPHDSTQQEDIVTFRRPADRVFLPITFGDLQVSAPSANGHDANVPPAVVVHSGPRLIREASDNERIVPAGSGPGSAERYASRRPSGDQAILRRHLGRRAVPSSIRISQRCVDFHRRHA